MSGFTLHLLAYDIRDPKRLIRLHSFMKKRAFAVQYSVFLVEFDSRKLADLVADIRVLIDERAEDVRIYALPTELDLETLGRATWPAEKGLHLATLTTKAAPKRRKRP